MSTLLKRIGLCAAILAVLIASPGGVGAAASDPDTESTPDALRLELYEPADIYQAPPERCAERESPNGGRAYICSAYTPYRYQDHYVSFGYYRGTLYGRTFVQLRDENGHYNLTTRPDFRGIWNGFRSIQFRACLKGDNGVTQCGAWS